MRTILIIDDNDEYRFLLDITLKKAGYEIFSAENAERALEILDRTVPNLILLDIMMPEINGFEFIRMIRRSGINIPVIMVTALDSFRDMKESFDLGADDYMTKPINMEELLLRINALLRRSGALNGEEIRLGGCVLMESELSVTGIDAEGRKQKVFLRPREFELLTKLASRRGRIFTRQEIMDDVWGFESESDPRTVDTHIKRLREKLAAFEEIDISTVRGLGYKMTVRENVK